MAFGANYVLTEAEFETQQNRLVKVTGKSHATNANTTQQEVGRLGEGKSRRGAKGRNSWGWWVIDHPTSWLYWVSCWRVKGTSSRDRLDMYQGPSQSRRVDFLSMEAWQSAWQISIFSSMWAPFFLDLLVPFRPSLHTPADAARWMPMFKLRHWVGGMPPL